MAVPTQPLDIFSALKADYYDKSRKMAATPQVGQIVFTPVQFTERRPHVVEAVRSDPAGHRSADIQIRPLHDTQDFQAKQRLPVKALNLANTEELLAVKAKKRPCLVVASSKGVSWKSLPSGVQQNKAINAFDAVYLLAPLFSVSTAHEPTSFGPVMTARIRHMMYPEFVFAPQSGGIITQHSIIRLDRTFWATLLAASEAQDLFVSNEIMAICWSQLAILGGNLPFDSTYAEIRECMLEDLPTEFK